MYLGVSESRAKKRESGYQLDESFSALQARNSQKRGLYSNPLPVSKRRN